MADALGSYPQFRLNFEQQGKRAKDLLKAARAGEAEALARFKSPPRLAEAQYLIARELRFDNWASMKRHISEMTLAREAMHASAPDSDLPTLHIRCGHDLQESLKEAGFGGDYYVDIYPISLGLCARVRGTSSSVRATLSTVTAINSIRHWNTKGNFDLSRTRSASSTIPPITSASCSGSNTTSPTSCH
jgi:hypothetical protein